MTYPTLDAVRRRRPTRVAVATAAVIAAAAVAPARAGLTFTNTLDATSDTPLTADQQAALSNAEAGFAAVVTTTTTVKVNVINLSAADFQARFGGGVAVGAIYQGYYSFDEFRRQYQAHAASPLQVSAAAALATNVVSLSDAYTPLYTPANASNPAFATTVDYASAAGTVGARTVRSQFLSVAPVEARVLGLQGDIYASYFGVTSPDQDLDLYLSNDPNTVRPYSFGPLGSPVPAGRYSYTKLMASFIGNTMGLASGLDVLKPDLAGGAAVHDATTDASDYNFEDYPWAMDLFRYRTVNGSVVRDLEIGDAPTYFSADGRTALAQLGTGTNGASVHLLADDPAGVFSGFSTVAGQSYMITGADAAVLDTLGFAVVPSAVPEPAAAGAVGLAAAGVAARRRRRA